MAVTPRTTSRPDRSPRVFIEFGSYHSLNSGDLAMLQVVVGRLRERYPQAVIHVTNAAPERLARVCPDVVAVLPEPSADRGVDGYLPPPTRGILSRRDPGRRRAVGVRWLASRAARPPYRGSRDGRHREVLDVIRRADLVLVSGGGAMTDAFLPHPFMILDRLELGAVLGSVTAMVGQGIGPIEDLTLTDRMRGVLPMVDLIALREPRRSASLLEALGVRPERMRMTGDDAIGLACASAGPVDATGSSNGLGVNLRISDYSGVTSADAQLVARVLRDHATRHSARLVPVPISLHPGESDAATLRSMFGGDGGAQLTTPSDVVERVRGCRVVVTGSYHAAVFALAQGIPAVGISSSRYYADKFGGLAALFPGGCDVVSLDQPGGRERLAGAVAHAWQQAPGLRSGLRAAAAEQVAASRAAFASVAELVDRRMAQDSRRAALRRRTR